MKYDIHVGVTGPLIRSDLILDYECKGLEEPRVRIWTKIIDTEDRMIRDKLIARGWTPPPADRQEKAPDLADRG